jgi:choline dehydrogenase-like flavoprotein
VYLDAKTFETTTVHDADVCVAGTGPAGLVVACGLARRGHDVVVLESGTRDADLDSQLLNDGDSAGDPYSDLRSCRQRQVGGTPNIWNTGVAGQPGARYVPLDPIDCSPRPWVAHSGWPLSYEVLDHWYRQAHHYCGLGPWEYEAPDRPGLTSYGLAARFYRLGVARLFTEFLPAELAGHPRVRLITRASVTEIRATNDLSTPVEIHWRSPAGTAGTVRVRRAVLATGAIENARVLLASGFTRSPWLGRGFMEHPRDRCLRIVEARSALRSFERFIEKEAVTPGYGRWGRFAIHPQVLERERLLNASVGLYPIAGQGPPLSVARRVRRRLLGSAWHDIYGVTLYLEQAPDLDNRVTLSSRLDAFGRPLPRLEWRWRRADEVSRVRVRRLVATALEGLRFGRVAESLEVPLDVDAHHHAGTTRMSSDPAEGVVDPNCRMHETRGLYIAGASVFPTAGFANPTLTIVALALRLAEHLDADLSGGSIPA